MKIAVAFFVGLTVGIVLGALIMAAATDGSIKREIEVQKRVKADQGKPIHVYPAPKP